VVVAMAAVHVMQVAIHEIIDVIAVGDRLVATAGTMLVVPGVAAATVRGRAIGRVFAVHFQAVLLHPPGSHVMQVAVV
jgi:hypothetical protein